ncbi:Phospholipase A2 group XV (1-O-acylceramide synthase) (ACS) (LCAT-like lysophospholipase) (LLPL) (Lysophospholipase 3) (Lysosomal phospholipase A and acyltransferase) (Lysosomal phospholipase A2) (LPLA2) [Durusdinium trenchii]|uniref:Uncharacterized protein n=1 Tax=Durusdinium trenchii TaxID=1381693 RepID=A0ABP0JGG9_9DINO
MQRLLLLLLQVLVVLQQPHDSDALSDAPLVPVLIIPGDGGNQLQAKLDKPRREPHVFCARKTNGWTSLWLQVSDLLPGAVDCWSDNVKLHFDAATYSFRNTEGVQVRVPGFGGTTTVEFLDPDLKAISGYFHALVETLCTKHGYERGKSIAAAPYDFRLTPPSNKGFTRKIVALIEKMYESNGRTPVALLSHSMGSLVTLFLLNKQPQAWKDKHIASWTSIGGVFGGSALEFKLHASGDNVGIGFVRSQSVVKEQRSYETNLWMIPRPGAFPEEQVFLVTPQNKSFGLSNLEEFFDEIEYPEGFVIHNRTQTLSFGLPAPRVQVHLVIGSKVPTPLKYVYTKGCAKTWFHHDPTTTIFGDGDGTVNMESLLAPVKKWRAEQSQELTISSFQGIDHTTLVKADTVIADVVAHLEKTQEQLQFETIV